MNQILRLFQQRLSQLTQTFLGLLDNIQKSKLFTCSPSHSEHRMEYIGYMIKTTLQNQQQKTIKKLLQKIHYLSQQPCTSIRASQFSNPNIEIPVILQKEPPKKQWHSQTPFQPLHAQTPVRTSKSPRHQKHTCETKMNSFEDSNSNSYSESEEKSILFSDQSTISYKFKYLKIKL